MQFVEKCEAIDLRMRSVHICVLRMKFNYYSTTMHGPTFITTVIMVRGIINGSSILRNNPTYMFSAHGN